MVLVLRGRGSTSANASQYQSETSVASIADKARFEPAVKSQENSREVANPSSDGQTIGDQAGCLDELSKTKAELEQYLPAQVRFERSESAPELQAELEPEVLKHFDADQPAHDLECRGRVCKLSLAWAQGADRGTWQHTIQTSPEMQNKICGMGFGAGRPTTDSITGAAMNTEEVWLTRCDSSMQPGQAIVRKLLEDFESAGLIERCKAEHPERGTLALRISLADGVFEIADGGDIAASGTGRCLSKALRAMAEDVVLPENLRGAMLFHNLEVE